MVAIWAIVLGDCKVLGGYWKLTVGFFGGFSGEIENMIQKLDNMIS
jgi:hypothetical protein